MFQNLDGLLRLPMGCGEQNLARLAPNLYALKYMKAIGSNNEALVASAVKNVKKGDLNLYFSKNCYAS